MKTLLVLSILVLTYSFGVPDCLAQSSAFTYQGRLADSGTPTAGAYDLRFTIYDSPTNGTIVSGPLSRAPISVTSGLFTVVLDFGSNVFGGPDRWLEIGVRTNGSAGSYQVLTPRQPLTATPYAIRSGNASSFTGAISDSQLSANIPLLNGNQTFSGAVTFSGGSNHYAGSFSGDATGLTNLASEHLTGAITVSNGLVNIGHVGNISAEGVAFSGHFAFVATTSGLNIYDVANPAAPTLVSQTSTAGYATDVRLNGNYAYVACTTDGIHVYNVSDPANPVSIWQTNLSGYNLHVAVANNTAFLTGDPQGIAIYDVTNPTNGITIGHMPSENNAWNLALSGSLAFIVESTGALRIYDISNPANPVFLSQSNTGGSPAYGVAVASHFAYVAAGTNGLQVFDVADPANPKFVGHADSPGYAYAITTSGDFVWLADGVSGVCLYDVSNPAKPVLLSQVFNGGYATYLAVSGGTGFLAGDTDGLRVYQNGIAAAPGFQGDGSRLTNLNAGALFGTVPDMLLSPNVALLGQTQTFTGQNSFTAPVLLGNANSGAPLAVRGAGTQNDQLRLQETTNPAHLASFGVNSTSDLFIQTHQSGVGAVGNIILETGFPSGSYQGGNVGIGTRTPGRRLTVQTASNSYGIEHTDGSVQLDTFVGGSTGGGWLGTVSNDRLNFFVNNGSAAMTVETNGNVGIGIVSPGTKLQVNGTVSATAFTIASDRNLKEHFAPVNSRDILDKVLELPLTTWNYRTDPGASHLGPMAQDFRAAFGFGTDDKHIATVDADGVALAAIQGLNQKLEQETAAQRAELQNKDRRITDLEQRLQRLEKLLNDGHPK